METYPPPIPDLDDELGVHQRHAAPDAVAWVLVFSGGVLLGLSGLFWLSRGYFFDNRIYEAVGGTSWLSIDALFPGVGRLASLAVRLYGLAVLCLSLLVIMIAVTGYRTAERWAWYAIWIVPVHSAMTLAVVGAYRALSVTSVAWHTALMCMTLLGLTLPYRRFFPNNVQQAQREGAEGAA